MQTTLQRAWSRQSSGFVTFRARPQPRYRSPQLTAVCRNTFAQTATCSICVQRRHNNTISAFSKSCDKKLSHCGGPVRHIGPVLRGYSNQIVHPRSTRYFSTAVPSLTPFADGASAPTPTEAPTVALDDLRLWTQLFRSLRTSHGDEGVWAFFELLREKHRIHLLCRDSAFELRKAVVEATVAHDKRLEALLGVATRLRAFQQEWPGLYGDAMSSLLRQSKYACAIDRHHRLSEVLHPGPDAVASLLSGFILDPSEDLQSCLRTIYNYSPWRNQYDRVIPLLYDAGRSQLAREWRKLFLDSGDSDPSQACRPYLKHLVQFYPLIQLSDQEVAVLKAPPSTASGNIISDTKKSIRGTFRDEFVAKTFASQWLSIDFAINSVYRLGLTEIGPRAMQALALREPTAEQVASRVAQLEKLGLEFSDKAYCNSLVAFARTGEEKLLKQLLECDVHPDEFDDPLTRGRMAKQPGLKTLMQGVDWALGTQTSRVQLNSLLQNILRTRHVGKALLILSRMDALKISITQRNADILLVRATHGLSEHRPKYKAEVVAASERLDRFVLVLRKLLHHEVGVSIAHWQLAFYLLGRLGRFDEWLQLALELVRRFKPTRGGLIPMHPRDRLSVTQSNTQAQANTRSNEGDTYALQDSEVEWEEMSVYDNLKNINSSTETMIRRNRKVQAEETDWVPSDLNLSNERHPVTRIFDDALQRALLRWGFDQVLLDWPRVRLSGPRIPRNYDIATGLYIVKVLRNHGVLVRPSLVRAVIVRRSVMAQLPNRRHRARDTQEVSLEHIMRIVHRVWGTDLLGTYDEFEESVAIERAKIWRQRRNDMQFARAFAGTGATEPRSTHSADEDEGFMDGEVLGDEITDDKITDNEITGYEIIDSEVTDDEITDDEITDDEITDDEIIDSEITDDEIIDSEITDVKTDSESSHFEDQSEDSQENVPESRPSPFKDQGESQGDETDSRSSHPKSEG